MASAEDPVGIGLCGAAGGPAPCVKPLRRSGGSDETLRPEGRDVFGVVYFGDDSAGQIAAATRALSPQF